MKVQRYYGVTNVFQLVFWVKYIIVRHVMEVHKSETPCFLCRSLLLSTTVLNDICDWICKKGSYTCFQFSTLRRHTLP